MSAVVGVSSQGSSGRGCSSKVTLMALAGFSFSQGHSSLLAVGQWPPSLPCQMGLSIGQLSIQQLLLKMEVNSQRNSENEPGWESLRELTVVVTEEVVGPSKGGGHFSDPACWCPVGVCPTLQGISFSSSAGCVDFYVKSSSFKCWQQITKCV